MTCERVRDPDLLFLTVDQLVELTGRKRAASQLAWLREHGYRHDLSAGGRPIVLLAEVERHLLGAPRDRGWQGPRLDLVRRRGAA